MASDETGVVRELGVGAVVFHNELRIRGKIIASDEGWWKVRWADDSTASCRPSSLALARPTRAIWGDE